MPTKYQTFDGYTEGQALPSDFGSAGGDTAATFWTPNGTVTVTSAAAMNGSLGARISATSPAAAAIVQGFNAASDTRTTASMYFRLPTGLGTASYPGATFTGTYMNVAGVLDLKVTGGNLALQWSGSTTAGGAVSILTRVLGAFTAGTTYFIRLGVTRSSATTTMSSRIEANIYIVTGGSGTTMTQLYTLDDGAVNFSSSGRKVLTWGNTAGATTNNGNPYPVTSDYDYVAWSDLLTTGFPGAQPTLPPPGGNLNVWDGSQWVAKPVKVNVGGVWTAKPVKYWNGTAWVRTPR